MHIYRGRISKMLFFKVDVLEYTIKTQLKYQFFILESKMVKLHPKPPQKTDFAVFSCPGKRNRIKTLNLIDGNHSIEELFYVVRMKAKKWPIRRIMKTLAETSVIY